MADISDTLTTTHSLKSKVKESFFNFRRFKVMANCPKKSYPGLYK